MKNFLESLITQSGWQPSGLEAIMVAAVVGFVSSMTSDTVHCLSSFETSSLTNLQVTNSIRVVKTTVQTSEENRGYIGTVRHILKTDGWFGLFFRYAPLVSHYPFHSRPWCSGLGTKTLTSALNGLIFNVMLRQFR